MKKDFDQEALFWGHVLNPIIFKAEGESRSDRQILLEISERPFRYLDGELKTISLSTLKRKWRKFKKERLKGLARKERSDKDSLRFDRDETLKSSILIREELPSRSVKTINQTLSLLDKEVLPQSTLYRHLHRRRLTSKHLVGNSEPVRIRWTRDHTHSLWIGDFQDGPKVNDQGIMKKTYLSSFIDVHSRFIVYGAYSFGPDTFSLIESLLGAWKNHGKSLQIYLDNAKVYRSPRLNSACLDLGIQLLHRAPYDPEGGGLIERFFKTSQDAFETEIRAMSAPLDLKGLNDYFHAWLAESYHKSVHSETKQTPKDRYKSGHTGSIRYVDTEKARDYFKVRIPRTVERTFSDIVLDNKFYRVDKKYRGEKVEVRYDPYTEDLNTVGIYDLQGKFLCDAPHHDRSVGEAGDPLPPKKSPEFSPLDLMKEKHESSIHPQENFEKMRSSKVSSGWSFEKTIQEIGELFGGKGLSEYSEAELKMVRDIYENFPALNQAVLKEAWSRCGQSNLTELFYQLQNFLGESSC